MEKNSENIRGKKGQAVIFLSLAAALISIKGLSLTPPTKIRPSFSRTTPQSILWVILFFVLWIGLARLSTLSSPKQKKTAFGIAFFYWCCSFIGYFLKEWGTVTFTGWSGLSNHLNFICYEIGLFFLIYSFILLLILLLDRYKTGAPSGRLLNSTKLLFVGCFFLLLVCWMPWFLRWAPVITTGDSNNHIAQASGSIPLMDNHPILYTLFIRLLFRLGGSNQAGAFLYSILQLLTGASVFSACICFVNRMVRRKAVTVFLILWFALYPLYPIFGITMWKDVFFGLFVCMITLSVCEIRYAEGARLKKLLICNVLLSLVMCFIRHNGFLVFIPTAVVLALNIRDHKRFYISLCLGAIGFYLLFQFAAIPLLGVLKWRNSEGFSIPLQQIARVVFYNPDTISEEQREIISHYFNGHDLADLYNPVLSNNVKYRFDEEAFAEDPSPMLRLWLELFLAYPKTFTESILQNSYGYWYPEALKLKNIMFGMNYENYCGIHSQPLIRFSVIDSISAFLENDRYYTTPVLSWLFTPGLFGWLLFFFWRYCRYSGRRLWPAFVPLLSLWVQMLASPAFCEMRYVYGLVTSLPLMICCTLLPSAGKSD